MNLLFTFCPKQPPSSETPPTTSKLHRRSSCLKKLPKTLAQSRKIIDVFHQQQNEQINNIYRKNSITNTLITQIPPKQSNLTKKHRLSDQQNDEQYITKITHLQSRKQFRKTNLKITQPTFSNALPAINSALKTLSTNQQSNNFPDFTSSMPQKRISSSEGSTKALKARPKIGIPSSDKKLPKVFTINLVNNQKTHGSIRPKSQFLKTREIADALEMNIQGDNAINAPQLNKNSLRPKSMKIGRLSKRFDMQKLVLKEQIEKMEENQRNRVDHLKQEESNVFDGQYQNN